MGWFKDFVDHLSRLSSLHDLCCDRCWKSPLFSIDTQNVSIGAWEEPDMGASPSALPISPTSGGSLNQQETPELLMEYWSHKGQSQKVCYDSSTCALWLFLL